ncbi:MAG: DUF481 domain-containing protein [Thermoanaerobaculia bacterium]|nr:DUF481 domain-containing protein [Thermoanaerobaculia bacterium]
MFRRPWAAVGLSSIALLSTVSSARAEEKKLGWTDQAELTYVATSGNAEATTLGLRNLLNHTGASSLFTFEAAALRADSTTRSFTARLGPVDEVIVTESSDTEVTAEKYLARLRYERTLSGQFYGFVGAGWEQNELAGIHSRTSAVAGVGRVWFDGDTAKFKTDLGATWTREEPTVFRRGVPRGFAKAQDFGGLRFTWGYLRKFGSNKTTTYTNDLIVDANLDDTDDLRADMINALAVAMTDRLALKVAHQLLYDHQPGFRVIPIGTTTPPIGFVTRELDDLDTVVTVALVVNF